MGSGDRNDTWMLAICSARCKQCLREQVDEASCMSDETSSTQLLQSSRLFHFNLTLYVVTFCAVLFTHSNSHFCPLYHHHHLPNPTTIPRHLSSPSLQTSSLGWSTNTCTALMAPCMDLSTIRCPTLMSATSRKAKNPWIRCTSDTLLRCAGGKSISVYNCLAF